MLKILPPYLLAAGILTPPFIMASTSATEAKPETPKQQYGALLTGFRTYREDISAPKTYTGPVVTVSQPAAPKFAHKQPLQTTVVAISQPNPPAAPVPVPLPPPPPVAVTEPVISIRPAEAELHTLPAAELPVLLTEIPAFSENTSYLPPPTPAVSVSSNADPLPSPEPLPEPSSVPVVNETADLSLLVAVETEIEISSTGLLINERFETIPQTLSLQVNNNQILINDELHDELLVSALPGEVISVGGTSYRGSLLVKAEAGQLYLINILTIDEFLYSQVSTLLANTPAIGDPAHFAIAVRTAALQARQTPANLWYDLDATQLDYFGADAETLIGIASVKATRGQVIQPESPALLTHN